MRHHGTVLHEHEEVTTRGHLRQQLREERQQALAEGQRGVFALVGESVDVRVEEEREEEGAARKRIGIAFLPERLEEGVGRTNSFRGIVLQTLIVRGQEGGTRLVLRIGRENALRLHHLPRHFQTRIPTQLVVTTSLVNMVPQLKTAEWQHVLANGIHLEGLEITRGEEFVHETRI